MNRLTIIISLLAIALLLCIVQFCHRPSQNISSIKSETYWRERNEKEMKQLDRSFKLKLSLLQKRNDSLQSELNRTKFKLHSLKLKLHSTGLKVLALATKPASATVTQSEDALETQSDCDSLKQEVISYVQQVDSVSRLYEQAVNQLEKLVQVKDTSIILCKYNYAELKEITEDNLRREQRLTEELNQSIKAGKRNRVKNKLLTAGLIVVSGLLIGALSKSELNR